MVSGQATLVLSCVIAALNFMVIFSQLQIDAQHSRSCVAALRRTFGTFGASRLDIRFTIDSNYYGPGCVAK